jgi:hypothetical protein
VVSRIQERVLSNKAFKTLELLQRRRWAKLFNPTGRSLLASNSSLVSLGG